MSDWQPIENAPRHAWPIDPVFLTDGKDAWIGLWGPETKRWINPLPFRDVEPTHYQAISIPEPPVQVSE